jgi:CheY-like chemotaxis protein
VTRILVVEDEMLIRDFVLEELEDAGFEVVVASNADEAIVILETQLDIRLVFTDIDMPGSINGMKLAEAIRERWPPIHLVITSGNALPSELPARAMFIPKPYLGRNVGEVMRTFENVT